MKKYGAVIFFFIAVLAVSNCLSQVVVDPTVETLYKEAKQKVPEEFQVIFKQKDEPGLSQNDRNYLEKIGYGFYTLYQLDTLNKEDLSPPPYARGMILVEDIDSVTGKTIPAEKPKKYAYSDGRNTYIPIMITAVLKNDSLQIDLPFIWEPQIKSIVTNHSVSAVYWDYRKYDSVFRLGPDGPNLNEIHLPMGTKQFSLSSNFYKIGDILYGEAEQATPVFYEEDPLFKTGYIKQQLHVKYFFQIVVVSPENFL